MDGFKWSPTTPYVSRVPGDNGWCMRDAVCRLFGWKPGSKEWSRFIEAPAGPDTPRLADHLGLTVFYIGVPEDWDQLKTRSAHPGIAAFDLPADQMGHVAYVCDVRWLLRYWPTPDGQPSTTPALSTGWPLGPVHMSRRPVLRAVLVDERQSPRDPAG